MLGSRRNRPDSMAEFTIERTLDLPSVETWRRLFEMRRHSAVIPLTTLSGAVTVDQLAPGAAFSARTGVGPLGFDDRMVVREVTHPSGSQPGGIVIDKLGRVVRGQIRATVEPVSSTRSRLTWVQRIAIPGLPAAVVGPVAKVAYETTIARLLRMS